MESRAKTRLQLMEENIQDIKNRLFINDNSLFSQIKENNTSLQLLKLEFRTFTERPAQTKAAVTYAIQTVIGVLAIYAALK